MPSRAASLADRAGQMPGPFVEQLEPRQLLFALAADATSPNFTPVTATTGQVALNFAYAIPLFRAVIPEFQDPIGLPEPLDENAAPGAVTNGLTLPETFLRFNFSGLSGGSLPQIVRPQADAEDLELSFGLGAGPNAQFSLSFRNGGAANARARFMIGFQFTTRVDANAIDSSANGTRIQLFQQGRLIATFDGTGAAGSLPLAAQISVSDPATTPPSLRVALEAPGGQAFDEVRFTDIAGGTPDAIAMDDITALLPPGRFADMINGRSQFGATGSITGNTNAFLGIEALPRLGLSVKQVAATSRAVFDNNPAGLVASGTTLLTPEGDRFRVAHTGFGVGTGPTLVAGTGGALDRDLSFTLNQGQTVSFSFPGPEAGNPNRPLISFSFRTPAAGGLLDAGTQIELLRNGVVVTTFTPTELTDGVRRIVDPNDATQFVYAIDTTAESRNPVFDAGAGAAFDTVRISRVAGAPGVGADAGGIVIDNVTGYSPTLVEFFDNYGRPMRPTIAAINPGGVSPVPFIDADDNGVPDWNDGIGRVVFSNSDLGTVFNLVGGTVEFDDQQGYIFNPLADLPGLYSAMEDGGFGFLDDADRTTDPAAEPDLVGLSAFGGSVIIGAPFFRDNTTPFNYHGIDPTDETQIVPRLSTLPLGAFDFNNTQIQINPPQPGNAPPDRNGDGLPDLLFNGVFAERGQSVGSVSIHGLLLGSSTFDGAVGRLNVSTLLGSVSVAGDLGALFVQGDAGAWLDDANPPATPIDTGNLTPTGSAVTVGRTVGQVQIGGRNFTRFNVLADVNNASRARLNFVTYREQEVLLGIDPASVNDPEQVFFGSAVTATSLAGTPVFFANGAYRNDTLLGAEWIGHAGRAVTVSGALGQWGPLQDNGGNDFQDTYAFAAQAGERVSLNVTFDPAGQRSNVAFARVVDARGRTIANHEFPFLSPNRTAGGAVAVNFAFTPTDTDVYYLLLATESDGGPGSALTYSVSLTGLAGTTVGMISVGANSPAFISTPGSLGYFRVGAGAADSVSGANILTGGLVGTFETADDFTNSRGLTLNVTGNLFAADFGSDIEGSTITVGGFLGALRTGVNPLAGAGPTAGDAVSLGLTVGGSIGVIDISGSMGFRQDVFGQAPVNPAGPVNIRAGSAGGAGDIGAIFVRNFVIGQVTTITTAPGATIDRFFVGNPDAAGNPNFAADGDIGRIALGQPRLNLGPGGDVRFADFDRLTAGNIGASPNEDQFTLVGYNDPVTFTDDSGATFQINVTGGANARTSFVQVYTLPSLSSSGVVISRIVANLQNGANLVITGLTPGVVSIGRVVLTTGAGALRSNISIVGNSEIDVYRIDHVAGNALNVVENRTRGGDIVVADLGAVSRVFVQGNLGRTQVGTVSPRFIGPFLGISNQANPAAGAPLFLDGGGVGSANTTWDGGLFTPQGAPAGNSLEDLGSPIDPYLNGLRVRAGGIQDLTVNGSVGDVLLTDANGTITQLLANADRLTPIGGFEGIEGNIYAGDINLIDIGDGLVGPGGSSFAAAGIFANNDIQIIRGGSTRTSTIISGLIIARNADGNDRTSAQQGIGTISLTGGRVDGAFIGGTTFDSWWRSARLTDPTGTNQGDPPAAVASINILQLNNASIFRSRIFAVNVGSVTITNGVYDATTIDARGAIGTVRADEFRNSTRDGEPAEYRFSQILAAGNVNLITATRDISDLVIDVSGRVTGTIQARNFVRAFIQADLGFTRVVATNDVRSSRISGARIDALSAGGDIRSTRVDITGPILTVSAIGAITDTDIISTGPDSRIDSVRAGNDLTGLISSAGRIGSVTSLGDIEGTIRTTDPTDGTLGTLTATGDLIVTLDIDGNVGTVTAGRDIGRQATADRRDAIDILGTLGTLTAGGQIYSDVRVGQSVTGSIRMGRVLNLAINDKASDAAFIIFGRLPSFSVTGDFAGSILSHSGGIGAVSILNGSFRRGTGVTPNRIEARDGDLTSLTITNGSLLGDVIARDGSIGTVSVTGAQFGDVGVNPARSSATPVTGDTFRNQLPPGAATSAGRDGPTISAALDITSLNIAGSIFESTIRAGRTLGTLTTGGILNDGLTPNANSTVILAGDRLNTLTSRTLARGLTVLAGVTDLGADNAPGGVGANADTVKSGSIGTLTFGGGTDTVTISAGLNAGADGLYNTGNDDTAAPGLSTIGTVRVTGNAAATSVFADTSLGATTATTGAITRGGVFGSSFVAPAADARTYSGPTSGPGLTPIPAGGSIIATVGADSAIIRFAGGAGAGAVYDQANARVIVFSTTGAPVTAGGITVDPNPAAPAATLTNLQVVTTDDVTLSNLTVRVDLRGNSNAFVDGNLSTLNLPNVVTTGAFAAGGAVSSASVGRRVGTTAAANQIRLEAATFGSVGFTGDFGTSTASRLDALSLTSLTVTGDQRAVVSVDRDLGSARITGALNQGRIRAGRDLTTFSAASTNLARVVAGNVLGTVSVTGSANETAFLAGPDLGDDANFGGAGANADRVTSGEIRTVTIGGDFTRSDVATGTLRGADGFINTADDQVSEGRGNIGPVTIRGSQIGSTFGTQRFGIIATGTLGRVTVANQPVTTVGNFSVRAGIATPAPVQVTDLRLFNPAPRLYSAQISFSTAIDSTTLAAALSIAEVREGGSTVIALVQGTDYTLRYDANTRTAIIDFSEAVAARNLFYRSATNLASPGVYRVELDAGVLVGATVNNRLDGNGDGIASGSTDDYSTDVVIGDAGDRLVPGRAALVAATIDFYGPADLNVLLDDNRNADGLPDANVTHTLRGILGDHPDQDLESFSPGGDIDVFSIFLRAGQTLRLGALSGEAALAGRVVMNATGTVLFSNGGDLGGQGLLQRLNSTNPTDTSESFLVLTSGVYHLALVPSVNVLSDFQGPVTINNPTTAPASAPAAGTFGAYAFDLEVIDDGDSGFNGPIADPDAVPLTTAPGIPVPADFDGLDNILGNADDALFLNRNATAGPAFRFVLDSVDGILGNANDVIRGTNGRGQVFERRTGLDGAFGTADDQFLIVQPGITARPTAGVPVPTDFPGFAGTISLPGTDGSTFVFSLDAGPDGTLGTGDDLVVGTNGNGVGASRTAGPDLGFGNSNDLVRVFLENTVAPGGAGLLNGQSPVPNDFRGPDNTLGTLDDLTTISRRATSGPDFVFRLIPDASGSVTTADVIVRGDNGRGNVISRFVGGDGLFGTVDDFVTRTEGAGDGVNLPQIPRPSAFRGPDNILGTADDLVTIRSGEFVFRYDRGANNRADGDGTTTLRSDDLVIGTPVDNNTSAATLQLSAGADGRFGTLDDATTIRGAIGSPGATGPSQNIALDGDVFHLNNAGFVNAGSRFRVTLKLSERGHNLGLLQPIEDQFGNVLSFQIVDNRGLVQLGLFDTTSSGGISDALLVAAPTRVGGFGTAPTAAVNNGITGYGVNSEGDFFLDLLIPEAQVPGGGNGTFALYVQGAVRSDYQLEVVQLPAVTLPTTPSVINVLLERNGGQVNWLEANPFTPTTLAPFSGGVAGFSGRIGTALVDDYIIDNTVATVQAIFDAALGAGRVIVSDDASVFEGQSFQTVFLSASPEPTSFIGNNRFGEFQRGDAFSSNPNDEAVVFIPSLLTLGNSPDQTGVDNFVRQLSAAVTRRVGDLVGLRAAAPAGNFPTLAQIPVPNNFRGADNLFGTADDIPAIAGPGGFVYALDAGPDATLGTADDFVFGDNDAGIVVASRTSGTDGIFGTADDVITASYEVSSSASVFQNLTNTSTFRFLDGTFDLSPPGDSIASTDFLFGSINPNLLINRLFFNP